MASTTRRRRGAYGLNESELKRRKKERDRMHNMRKVFIGDEIERWNVIKGENGVQNNEEWARILLDSYQLHKAPRIEPTQREEMVVISQPLTAAELSSTDDADQMPGPSLSYRGHEMEKITKIQSTPLKEGVGMPPMLSASEISSAEDSTGPMPVTLSGSKFMDTDILTSKRKRKVKDLSSIYGDPLSISLSIIEEENVGVEEEDHLYEPSVDITLELDNYEGMEDVAAADIVFGAVEETDEPEEPPETPLGMGLTRVLEPDTARSTLDDCTALVYLKQVKQLAECCFLGERCKVEICQREICMHHKFVGSTLFLTWVCSEDHVFYKWTSQPLMNRMVSFGDMMISSAILASGNNFAKIQLFGKCLNLRLPHRSTFERIQRSYVVPAIEKFWISSQEDLIKDMKDKDVVCLGDGRMDSPGHCAQYCSYTMIDNDTKKIISISTVDKRQVEKKSSNLEKAGFVKCMEELMEKGIHITEVVTDAHPQIGSLMKKKFPEIKHSHDIWHAAKNLCKKIVAAGQERENRELQQWSRDVTNHFWHACKEANTKEEWMAIWCGVIHHVCNEHSWAVSYGDLGAGECNHGELNPEERTKPWLTKGSPAHAALVKIVLNTRLLNQVPYFINFRHTSETENFQNHILMYAGKRFAYTPPVYKARNLLAALDHNEHIGRPVKRNQQGEIYYTRCFNKKSGRWSASPVKVEKTYPHLPELFMMVLQMRLADTVGMKRGVTLPTDDPRLISPNIAPILPQDTRDIVESQKSRHT